MGGGPPASRPRCELRSARRLEARPGPAAAHGLRSRAFRTLRRPPHRRRLCRCVWWSFPSKPGQALPPPMGAAAWPSDTLALLFCCLWRRWCSGRRRVRPRGRAAWCARGRRPAREPSAPRASLGASPRSPARPRPPPTGTAAWPSGPSDALHTGGACGAVCGGASPRSPARPCRRPWVLQVGYPDPPAPSMPAVLPGFAIDRIARGYCTG